jgi:DNA-binding MarR family transcriptional regulator
VTREASQPPLQLLQNVGLLFRTVNLNFREQVDRALRDGGVELGFGHVSALGILEHSPGSNGAEVARHGMVSAQAMNAVLRGLADDRYVERRDHPGSLRADAWFLTDKGARLLLRARGIFGAVMTRMLSALTPPEQREFERFLRLCAASLEQPPAKGAAVSAGRRERSAGGPRRRSSGTPSG